MRGLIAGLIVAAAAGPAAACLNDVELPSHEREFRSQYRGDAPAPPSPSPGQAVVHTALYSSGAVLLVGAVGLAVTRRRAEV